MRIQEEEEYMKLLKAESGCASFLNEQGEYEKIESISKDDILRFLDLILKNDVTLDDYKDAEIKNQAHQIVYKSLYENLKSFIERKSSFIDESERLYLEDYKRYVDQTEI